MRLYVEKGDQGRSVALAVEDDSATIGELCEALDLDAGRGLTVDGRYVEAHVRVVDAQFVDGSTVHSPDAFNEFGDEAQRWWVGVTAGPDAGVVYRLPSAGVVRVGRNSESELSVDNDSVSGMHAEIRVLGEGTEIVDLRSRNGTWVDGAQVTGPTPINEDRSVRLGSSELRIRSFDVSDRPLGSTAEHANDNGRILLNRPPRFAIPSGPAPLTLPDPVKDRANPKLSVPSLIAPVIFAGVMVAVLMDLRFALFALLSPIMVIGNYVSARRKVTGERKEDATTHASALEELDEDLITGIEHERLRRRHLGPDVVELRRRVEVPSNRLWERRASGDDALIVRIGRGDIPWTPPLAEKSPKLDGVADDVRDVLQQHSTVNDIELVTDLRQGVLGIHGDAASARALTRALALQVAVNHGPADVRIAAITTEDRVGEWSWLEWLPHAGSDEGGPPLVLHGDSARRLAETLLEQLPDSSSHTQGVLLPRWLLLVDDISLVHERASALRQILENSAAGIHGVVLGDRIDQLPASTAQVLEVAAVDGECSLGRVDARSADGTGIVDSVSVATATDIARRMARFEDPELELIGGGLPDGVSIRDILCAPNAEDVLERWRASSTDNSLAGPLGIGPEGPLVIDMTVDGPHGLVAGTTGAGKSELLRTMVIGLASEHSPDDLVFVLIDYKGGSAFDVCTSLPHVVGIVTDLDEHLSQRALRSLDAELHHRELVLREAEAKDIFEYRDMGSPSGPLPRLMVVIDEFATLRAELPDFVSALVGIAQRGRSLGVHLILATQRPSGAVDANIKANTNLRIALRVQDATDSKDVIDVGKAAELPRTLPGRAYVRRGEGDLTPVQTGYASGPVPTRSGPRLRVTSRRGGRQESSGSDVTSKTNLSAYVDACVQAGESYEVPRRPWVDPLPNVIVDPGEVWDLEALGGEPVTLAIGDDPDHQRRVRIGWDPTSGHVGVIGSLGSGVTTALKGAAIALGSSALGRPVWVYVADHGARGQVGLDEYPHIAPIVDADDHARHDRLMVMLERTLVERSQMGASVHELPLLAVVIDGIAGFAEKTDLVSGSVNGERFAKIVRDGPAVGIVLIVGATGPKDLPRALRGAFRSTFVLEQNDVNDYSVFGIRPKNVPTFVPGRAVVGEGHRLAHMIDWSQLADPGSIRCPEPPPSIDPLPELVAMAQLPAASVGASLSIPVGIDNESRDIAELVARAGEHITISGPPGSGRTSGLRLIAEQLRRADPNIALVGIATPDSNLFDSDVFDAGGAYDEVQTVLQLIEGDTRRWVLIVDDADRIDADSGPLMALARSAPSNVTIVAAVRSSAARTGYGHWSRFVRASGVGVLLQPDNSADSEILGVRLPRAERLEPIAGRGYLVQSGEASVVQLALVESS